MCIINFMKIFFIFTIFALYILYVLLYLYQNIVKYFFFNLILLTNYFINL